MTIDIRQEKSTDYQETLAVVQQAFLNEEYSNKSEHLLVSKLRKSAAFIPELSLIAYVSPYSNCIPYLMIPS